MKKNIQKFVFELKERNGIFFSLLLLLIADRFFLLTEFNFEYASNDDLVLWMAAKDYASGIFYEPFFYGQNYNPMLEALFAVPFYKMGVPLNYALPISTSIISLFPFVLFAIVLFKHNKKTAAYFFLILPILLPIEYGMLTSMPRGFVQGLFFTGFLIFPLLNPFKKTSWIVAALATALGFVFNPNSVLFSLPVCCFLFLSNFKNYRFYLISCLSVLPIFLLEFLAKNFYQTHPNYNIHSQFLFEYKFEDLLKSFQHLDDFYSYFMPIFWKAGWLILPAILIQIIFVFKKEKVKAYSLLFGLSLIIFSLGLNKVHDSIQQLIYTSARMYVAIPMFVGLSSFWFLEQVKWNEKWLSQLFLVLACSVFCIKINIISTVIKQHTFKTNFGMIAIKKIKEVKCECEKITELAKKEKVDLVVFTPNQNKNMPEMIFLAYGCPLLTAETPQTLLSAHERRTWVFEEEKKKIRNSVLFYGLEIKQDSLDIKSTKVNSDFEPSTLFNKNTLPLDSLFHCIGLNYAR